MSDAAPPMDPRRAGIEEMRRWGDGLLPGLLGIRVDEVSDGMVRASLSIGREHLAPNGYLHAGSAVTLADTACGYGTVASLPAGATGFTTIELKSNFLATVREGELLVRARRVHRGRTTQVWDAEVTDGRGRVIALFRCTQLVLSAR